MYLLHSGLQGSIQTWKKPEIPTQDHIFTKFGCNSPWSLSVSRKCCLRVSWIRIFSETKKKNKLNAGGCSPRVASLRLLKLVTPARKPHLTTIVQPEWVLCVNLALHQVSASRRGRDIVLKPAFQSCNLKLECYLLVWVHKCRFWVIPFLSEGPMGWSVSLMFSSVGCASWWITTQLFSNI